jgi:Glycosyltransferase WbsX
MRVRCSFSSFVYQRKLDTPLVRSGEEILRAHSHNEEDDANHICCLAGAFATHVTIRFHGRPLFWSSFIRLPDPKRTVEIWRNEARRLGAGGHFCSQCGKL